MVALGGLAHASAQYASSQTPPAAAEPAKAKHVQATLVSEMTALVPGSTTNLGVRFKIEDGWHIYWNGVNDTGVPPMIEFSAPEGFEVLPTVWPAPKRHIAPGDLLDHVYEGEVLLVIPIKVPASAMRGSSVTFTAKAKWLVCDEMCVPEEADLKLTMPISAEGQAPKAAPDAPVFARARQMTPQAFEHVQKDVSVSRRGSVVTLASKTASAMEFYPLEGCADIESLISDGAAESGTLRLTMRAREGEAATLRGVLALRHAKKWSYYHVEDPPPPTGAGNAPAKPAQTK